LSLGFFDMLYLPFLFLPVRDAIRLVLKGKYRAEKNSGIPCSDANKRKNLRVLCILGDLHE